MAGWSPEAGSPLVLNGDAYARGRGQAAAGPAAAQAVRAAIGERVAAARADGVFDSAAADFLAAQRAHAARHEAELLAELQGIADGFTLPEETLFEHLHIGTLRDLKRMAAGAASDGCTAWAVGQNPAGPLVVKNRDFSGSHLGIQRVFRHQDPSWRGGTALFVGSLGSPGAYSSGINAHGFALVDTQVGTSDHGVGTLRYFLMTRLLAHCRTVSEALDLILAERHSGGGTLVLADASGAAAAVELGHRAVGIERGDPVFRTNHFISAELSGAFLAPPGDAMAASSNGRRQALARALSGASAWTPEAAGTLMASHGAEGIINGAFCRHGEDGDARTISTAVFACTSRSLYLAEGNPCAGAWRHFRI